MEKYHVDIVKPLCPICGAITNIRVTKKLLVIGMKVRYCYCSTKKKTGCKGSASFSEPLEPKKVLYQYKLEQHESSE